MSLFAALYFIAVLAILWQLVLLVDSSGCERILVDLLDSHVIEAGERLLSWLGAATSACGFLDAREARQMSLIVFVLMSLICFCSDQLFLRLENRRNARLLLLLSLSVYCSLLSLSQLSLLWDVQAAKLASCAIARHVAANAIFIRFQLVVLVQILLAFVDRTCRQLFTVGTLFVVWLLEFQARVMKIEFIQLVHWWR